MAQKGVKVSSFVANRRTNTGFWHGSTRSTII
jgi:hypothetical protein